MGIESDRLGEILDPDSVHPRGQQTFVGIVQQDIRGLTLGERQPVVDVDSGDMFFKILIGQIGDDHSPARIHAVVLVPIARHVL